MIRRLAVLDRGEPAIRLLRTVHELRKAGDRQGTDWSDLRTVALVIADDQYSEIAGMADDVVLMTASGDDTSLERAISESGADAVWAADGCLLAHGRVADLCRRLGITYVGPGADVLRRMSDPESLSALAAKCGLRSTGTPPSTGELRLAVPVIADRHGTAWALGVHDVSIGSPSGTLVAVSNVPDLPPALVQQARDAATRLCRAAGFVGAGEVHFVINADGDDLRVAGFGLRTDSPLTDVTTGLDLVKLHLTVCTGGALEDDAPPVTCVAAQVRLTARDPQAGGRPAPGRLGRLRLPGGPGIRVDGALGQDERVSADGDLSIACLTAWGRDRVEALTRLARALEETSVVIEGGATDRSYLLRVLAHPDVLAGRADAGWLGRVGGEELLAGSSVPPEALLLAAVEVAVAEFELVRERFFAAAARGRPDLPDRPGIPVRLRLGDRSYVLRVLRTGQDSYQVNLDGRRISVRVQRSGRYDRRLAIGSQRLHALVMTNGPVVSVELNGMTHRMFRDDAGIVRASAPGVVVALPLQPGDRVVAGDTVAVLEMMKMEMPIAATLSGRIRCVPAALNVQVSPRTSLVEIEPDGVVDGGSIAIDLSALPSDGHLDNDGDEASAATAFAALHSVEIGYERDAAELPQLLAAQRRAYEVLPATSPLLREHENRLLRAFSTLGALSRRALDPSPRAADLARSPEEYLFTLLRSPARSARSLPESYLARVRAAVRLHGMDDLTPGEQFEDTLVLLFRATERLADVVPFVVAALDRRLTRSGWLPADEDLDDERALLDDLIEMAEGRYQTVADLAREVRFRWLDKPFLEATRSAVDAEAAQELQRLQDDPTDPERGVRIARLIACPQPLRWLLLNWYHRVGWAGRQVVLEATVRRYYRIRHLENLTFSGRDDLQWCTAEYDEPDGVVHLLLAYCPINELGRLLTSIDESLMMQPSDRRLVVDLHVWYPEDLPTAEFADEEIRSRAAAAERQAQYRLSITISEPDRDGVRGRTYHFTYRVAGASIAEDEFFRNLHPMLAERLDLWRLSNFVLERLDSVEDVYLFRGVALANPKDERLFALAEVRDITPVVDAEGRVTALPLMERMYLEALSGIRRYQSHRPEAQRLLQNQVILYVRPAWTVPPSLWEELAERQAVASRGLGIEEVIARVRIPTSGGKLRQQELHVTSPAGGVVVRQTAPEHSPVPVLSEFEWRALQTRRRGSHYPYDVIRMLTPRSPSRSVFPSGDFLEYDLVTDDGGNSRLQPVVRAPGGNTCNIVVGVLRNVTAEYPEGMARVALFGDPSRGMGNLAEAECRRIIAACDLAQAMRVPVEWFAVSAGAKIAMSSGTENMDWIAAVLRRLIEFTQGGGEINVIVTGINVGAQPYWNAEATMLMHTRGILVMIPESAMVLTGKTALDFSGGVSAEDNLGIGGYERIMGPNGQAQYYAPDLEAACQILFRHYAHTYLLSGERFPRRTTTTDPVDRDVRGFRHSRDAGSEFRTVGEIFAPETNVDRKKPFDIRSVMRAVTDADAEPLERWKSMRDADTVVVWDARIGGIPICLLGIESRPIAREGMLPADGPEAWTSGTLFPQSSRKTARAVNAASGNRPLVVLANLSGFDGSPESMRKLQLEYGAEIGRAVTNFRGPMVFVVISRYHGGAFVVFSKRLNPDLEVAAVEGSYASVIGGAPAAAVVFTRDVDHRTRADERVSELAKQAADAAPTDVERLRAQLAAVTAAVRAEKLGEVAAEFEHIHTIERARQMGSVDRIIPAQDLRPYLVDALERGIARELERAERSPVSAAEVASGELLLGH